MEVGRPMEVTGSVAVAGSTLVRAACRLFSPWSGSSSSGKSSCPTSTAMEPEVDDTDLLVGRGFGRGGVATSAIDDACLDCTRGFERGAGCFAGASVAVILFH